VRGLGGAQTALGGDISSASSNPAGLGFFNRSEFSITPNFNFVSANTDYLDGSTREEKLNFNFANLGIVLNYTKGDIVDSKWRGGNAGISINRIADYHSSVEYQGFNFNPLDQDGFLILDANNPKDFIESAVLNTQVSGSNNPIFDNDFAELAYDIGLVEIYEDGNNPGTFFADRNIYAVDENGDYITDVNGNLIPAFPDPDFPTYQQEQIKTRGATYQTSLAYGGNYDDRLYFGASLGIVTTSLEVERTFIEEPTSTDLARLTLSDVYEISGVGINATFGIIGRPVTPLLIGASYTTPTIHAMEQIQDVTLSAEFIDGEFFDNTFTYVPLEYTVRTPSKMNAGITYFFGKNGFLTADVERINYNGAFLSNPSENFSFSGDNDVISRFDPVLNIRGGVEFRFDQFRIRGGYAQLGDPIDNDVEEGQSNLTLGGGIRTKNYFLDLGIISSISGREKLISPYPGANLAEANINKTRVAISLGWFF